MAARTAGIDRNEENYITVKLCIAYSLPFCVNSMDVRIVLKIEVSDDLSRETRYRTNGT